MLIIPAIDLKGGRCVRLTRGLEQSAKVYECDPLEVARDYQRAGAKLIHVVDLDGAFLGAASDNQSIIRQIVSEIEIPVEVGGGIRTLSDIENLISGVGARFAILGTIAVEHPEILKQAIDRFGDSVIVGIDARASAVASRGWTRSTQLDVLELATMVADVGAGRIIYTDITRDGTLEGPNLEMTRRIAQKSRLKVTASGGVSSLNDIARLCELESGGVDSVIIGKALYEGRFTLKDAILTAEEANASQRE